MSSKRARRWASWVLLIVGVLCIAYVGSETAEAWLYQQRQTAAFERARAIRTDTPRTSKARRPVEHRGELVGTLDIPRLDLSTAITLGDDRETLARGAGLLADTSRPWLTGNTTIAGHRDGVFRPLSRIRIGDEIVVRTSRGDYRYRVRATRVTTPNDLSVLESHGTPSLTLITCYPFRYVGPAPKRYVVRAERIPTAKASRSRARSKRSIR